MTVSAHRKWARNVTLALAALGSLILFGMAHFAKREITNRANLDSGSELKLAGIYPSLTSWVRVSFRVVGDSEVSRVHWRLNGYVVDVEK